jgi:adenine deaminase
MRCNAALNILQDNDAHRMMRVALGQEPAQAAIVNARVVNIYTAEGILRAN